MKRIAVLLGLAAAGVTAVLWAQTSPAHFRIASAAINPLFGLFIIGISS